MSGVVAVAKQVSSLAVSEDGRYVAIDQVTGAGEGGDTDRICSRTSSMR